MVKAKRIVFDAKTQKQKIEEFEFTPEPVMPEVKGIDFEKLVEALVNKDILSSRSEVEGE